MEVMRSDKSLLSQKNDLLAREATRLKQSYETLSRQHALTQANLSELQSSRTAGTAAAGRVQSSQELNSRPTRV